jgi:hypothetical protein
MNQSYKTFLLRNLGPYSPTFIFFLTYELAEANVCREKGLLLSFVYKFGQVACRCC